MKYTIKSCDGKGYCNHTQAECDTWIRPTTEFVPDGVKDETRRTALRQYCQRHDRHNEEYNMAYSSNHLKGVQHATEPKIPYHRYDNKTPHNQSSMPSLWYVVGIVENSKSSHNVGEVSWRCRRCCNPCPYSDPTL
jgi:hypothetical protein